MRDALRQSSNLSRDEHLIYDVDLQRHFSLLENRESIQDKVRSYWITNLYCRERLACPGFPLNKSRSSGACRR
jgi:hypothetical protein